MFNFASRRRRRTKYYRYCQYAKYTKSLPRAIDPEDVRHLVRLTRVVRDKALILMLLRTGMRVGELLRIRLQDINLRNRKIIISESEKNRIGRVVYFSEDAKRVLKVWYSQRDPKREILFYGRGNNPLSYAAVRRMFCESLERSRLTGKSYTLHCLRHTPECRYAS
jgi:integrase